MARFWFLFLFSLAVCGEEPRFDFSRVGWRSLKFEASKFFMTASTEIKLEPACFQDLPGDLPRSPDGELLDPNGSDLLLLTLKSTAFGTTGLVQSWFREENADAILGSKLNTGRKNYRKIYRFTLDGVYTHRLSPDNRKEKDSVALWSEVSERYDLLYAKQPFSRVPVCEAPAIFYLLSASQLEKSGDSFFVYCFTGDTVLKLSPRVTGERELELEYDLLTHGGLKKVTEKTDVLEITLQAEPVLYDDESFKLLGLEGNVRVLLRKDNRMPVRVMGKAAVVRNLEIKLMQATLAESY